MVGKFMLKKNSYPAVLLLLCLCTVYCVSQAQNPLKSFQWRDHLAYNRATSIAEFDNKIYCTVTTTSSGLDPFYKQTHQGLFYYSKSDNSYGRLSKIDGLSDVDPVLIKANRYNNTLFISYNNSNIDILKNNTITNVSDILRKSILGNKSINAVTFYKQYAYLAVGFGIVVINTDNYEVKDTYIIGPNGSNINVYEVALDNSYIYAATNNGVYMAPLSSPNLANYQNWQQVSVLPAGPYNAIVNFKGTIYTNFSKHILDGSNLQDTIYVYNGTSWSPYPYKAHDVYGYHLKKLIADDVHNKLMMIDQGTFEVRDSAGNFITRVWGYGADLPNSNMSDMMADDSDPDTYWMADKTVGLLKLKANSSTVLASDHERYIPNGPGMFLASDIKIKNNKVFVAPVSLGDELVPSYISEGVYIFEDGAWRHIKKKTGTYFDINNIAVDTSNINHFYAASWGSGVLEFLNDSVIHVYDNTNSPLHLADGSSGVDVRADAVFFDGENNLWVAVAYSSYMLTVKKANGNWQDINFAMFYPTGAKTRSALMDKNKQIWMIVTDGGILVYKHDDTYATPNNSNTKKITTAVGAGKLPTIQVNCLAEDKEGDMWVGTNEGIAVFYNPEAVTTQTSGWDAQQIYIEQEGHTQILLETEQITCIAIDGANNKWIGTRKSGIFCLTHDGQKEIYHFTTANSPLFSNNIINVAVNGKNGEVFIATEKGMLSFQTTTIDGFETFEDVYAYPNPVKPNYTGPVIIKGMINGAVIKITDVTGNLVYETKAEGGQAVWYAKNFKGERVATGVYFVLCATSDGEQNTVSKILVVN